MSNQHNNNSKLNLVFTWFAIGFIIPVLAWLILMSTQDVLLTFDGFAGIHKSNPALWFTYLFPVLLAAFVYVNSKNQKKLAEHFTNKLDEREKKLNIIAEFAKEIGEGNYSSELNMEGEADLLQNSLLLMRDNLKANHKQESDQNWIAEGKDIISNILRMHNKMDELSYDVLVNLIKYIRVIQGALYLYDNEREVL
ncbi:MAG: hypothetical protein ACOC10_01995, partial [Bacteroidota bacterium]